MDFGGQEVRKRKRKKRNKAKQNKPEFTSCFKIKSCSVSVVSSGKLRLVLFLQTIHKNCYLSVIWRN